jgi:hypothetical protein
MAVLATVGSTAPFVGLFGTVWGIYNALVKIGISGQASIDKVAGPVGESLIMTAIGLAVAVPAVMGYNWLLRRNKAVMDQTAPLRRPAQRADRRQAVTLAPEAPAAPRPQGAARWRPGKARHGAARAARVLALEICHGDERRPRDDSGEEQLNNTINTTPLVDVMLVLLIIFLITVPVVTQTIKLELPKEATSRC